MAALGEKKPAPNQFTTVGGYAISIFVLLFVLVTIIPFVWAFLVSLRESRDIFTGRFVVFAQPSLRNYSSVIRSSAFVAAFRNTVISATTTSVVCVLMGAPAGYSLARYNVGGKALLMGILALRFFPVAIIIIPAYVFFNRLGLIDNMIAIVVMLTFISLPLVIWILRSFVLGIPFELEEAAMIDGCSPTGAMVRVTLPLCSQGLGVAALFPFVYSWNNLLVPLVLSFYRMKTLTIYASDFMTDMSIEWGAIMAIVVIMMVPVFALVLLARNHILKGFVGSGIK